MNEKGTTPRDGNTVASKLAVLNTDMIQGTHLVSIAISGDRILVDSASTISFTMQPIDPRDDNYAACWLFQGTDGLTYPAVANASGALLVDI